ncbi:MAG: hypothetical protein H0V95_01345 [Actinobacteria bacterium]|nr:hypothetical protein [Actinomycetota bacterium]
MISTEERVTTTTVVAERPDTRSWLAERISTEAAVLIGATWYVLFLIATGLEPRPTAPAPTWSVALSMVFLATLAITAGGLLARRRWGLLASLGAAGLFTAFSVACPISDHHGLAAWWFGQMACALALVGVSAFALARARA